MSDRPNIVFLLPDQLRPDFLGCYGADFLRTPHIDALADRGTRYRECISPSPICVPARATMLTGHSAHGIGVMDNLHWPRPDRRATGIETWPERLGAAGYRTAATGKMHFYPWDISEGFERRVIAEDKRHIHIEDDYDAALKAAGYRKLHGNDQRGYADWKGASFNDLPDELQVDRWVASEAARYIEDLEGDRPFALMVGFPGPHCPYDPPESALGGIDPARVPLPAPATEESRSHHAAFVASYRRGWADLDYSSLSVEEVCRIRHHYAALVERLDADVGMVLDALERSGRMENTIVVFASDHGDYLGDFGMVGKTYFHEPSVRVPLICTDFRAPFAGVSDRLTSLADLYSSFLEWAGLECPSPIEGVPLSQDPSDRIIVGATIHGTMARSDEWKLVRYRNGTEALYHLAADPDEQVNRIADAGTPRSGLDAALTAGLLDGFNIAHGDKLVREAQADPGHPFYGRDWARAYPASI